MAHLNNPILNFASKIYFGNDTKEKLNCAICANLLKKQNSLRKF